MTAKFQFKYKISFKNNKPNHILFQVEIPTKGKDRIELNLPVWRPGRYELANYAQYVKDFNVIGKGRKELPNEKIESSIWEILCKKEDKIIITYSFYSKRIDAGFSFADEKQIFINPVNCFLFVPNEKCEYEIEFKIAKTFQVHSPLKKISALKVKSSSYDELFDSPMIASKNSKVRSFKVGKYTIKNVFQGECKPNWDRIESDYKKFIKLQISCFGDLPIREFSFLNQITSHKFYHGVEHKKNTVLAFGPGYLLNEAEGYEKFLGLACHEFYHIWNVKHLRPKSLFPYDFAKQNYHHIGFVIEGVTTYQGDLKLWQSKVIDDKTYFKLLAEQIERHLNNDGRSNQSVRESSMDLWLDGYVSGIPGKKVSIYTEGALISLMIDIYLLESTKGKRSIDDVMRSLYENFAKKSKAYDQNDYLNTIVALGGKFAKRIFREIVNKSVSYEKELSRCLSKVGIEIVKRSKDLSSSYIGFSLNSDPQPIVLKVASSSPAEKAGFVEEMKILALNGMSINNDLENWLNYFKDDKLIFTISLKGEVREIKTTFSKHLLTTKVELIKLDKPNLEKARLFASWRKY